MSEVNGKPRLPAARGWRALYRGLLWLVAPLLLVRLVWRGRSEPEYRLRWWERFGFVETTQRGALWFHTVSAGEIITAAPLIQALQRRRPNQPIRVTTTTATGRERARNLLGSIEHSYLPYDYPSAVLRFLESTRPVCLVLMETELWPNLIEACKRQGVPVLLVNARLSERSAMRYRWVGALTERMLRQVHAIACQFEEHRQRFLALGANPSSVHVVGTLKFDIEVDLRQHEHVGVMRQLLQIGDRPVWIAGSTHEGEEAILLQAHRMILRRLPKALLILVPRHPTRAAAVAALLRELSYQRVSEREVVTADCSVLLGDRMGDLMSLYGLAQVSFVGGSLVDRGGHNVIEPYWHGCPVLLGPSDRNFAGIVQSFAEKGAIERVRDADDVARAVTQLLEDPLERQRRAQLGREVISRHQGAKERLIELIESVS